MKLSASIRRRVSPPAGRTKGDIRTGGSHTRPTIAVNWGRRENRRVTATAGAAPVSGSPPVKVAAASRTGAKPGGIIRRPAYNQVMRTAPSAARTHCTDNWRPGGLQQTSDHPLCLCAAVNTNRMMGVMLRGRYLDCQNEDTQAGPYVSIYILLGVLGLAHQ